MCPRLLHIYGPLWINSYGVMIALGFLLFLYVSYRHPLRKQLMSGEQYLNTVFVGLISAIVGGRLLFVISDLQVFQSNILEMFYPWVGGFSLLGSMIAVLIFIPLYVRSFNVPVLPVFDLAALYIPLLQMVARLGCFLSGCCYGIPVVSNSWYSVVFSSPEGLAPLHIPLHPTQLYSSVASLIIFLTLQCFAKRLLVQPGRVLFVYLMLESTARFLVDFWRGGRHIIEHWLFGFLSGSLSFLQLVAFGVFLFACCGFLFISSKK